MVKPMMTTAAPVSKDYNQNCFRQKATMSKASVEEEIQEFRAMVAQVKADDENAKG